MMVNINLKINLTSWALLAFDLELGDLSSVVNAEIFEESLGSLLVLVCDFLGFGVDLLLSLLFTTAKSHDNVNGSLCKKCY